MPANALVQTRIDPGVKERASAVLEQLGITVSDAVRILLPELRMKVRCRFLLPLTSRRTTHGSDPKCRRPSTILVLRSPMKI